MMRIVLTLLFLALTACGGGQAVAPVGVYSKPGQKTSKSTKKHETLHLIFKTKYIYVFCSLSLKNQTSILNNS